MVAVAVEEDTRKCLLLIYQQESACGQIRPLPDRLEHLGLRELFLNSGFDIRWLLSQTDREIGSRSSSASINTFTRWAKS